MENERFKVGDRVRTIFTKTTGTVMEVTPCGTRIKVDDETAGIEMHTNAAVYYGLYLPERWYVPIDEPEYKFTKADLHSGDVCVKRNGSVEICIVETGALVVKNGVNFLKDIENDLSSVHGPSCEIVKVYRPKEPSQCSFFEFHYTCGELVYDRERDEKPKFDRQAWIDEHWKMFINADDVSSREIPAHKLVVVFSWDGKKIGVSKCSKADEYNRRTGTAVAYAKLLGEKIPKEI